MLRKIILATTAATAISVSAFAGMGDMGQGMGGCDKQGMQQSGKKGKHMGEGYEGMRGDNIMSLKTVNLTAEQKNKIETLKQEFRAEMAKLHFKDKPMMQDPFAVAGGFNKEAFKKERMEKMQKFIDIRAEHLAKIWAVLTPEQQKSISALAK